MVANVWLYGYTLPEFKSDIMKKCKVCGKKTEVVFNINFKATPICESCATSIFLQQSQWYAKTKGKN